MEVPIGDTYYFKFTTRAFATGVPTTLAGTPVLSVYEENNLTQITAGVSITVDYDSVTGLHQGAVVATSANGYEAGKYYDVVITTGTVGGVSVVGEVVKHFRMVPAEDAGAGIKDVNVTHWLDTAAATPTTAGVPEVDVTHLGGAAQSATDLKDFADAGYDPATNKVQGVVLVDTTTTNTDMVAAAPTAAQNADAVWDEAKSGHVGAGSFGEEVQAHALSSEISALNDVAATDIVSAGAITTLSGAVVNVDTVDTCTTNTDMVAAAPTAAQNADAVWDEAKAGHVGAGSFGEEVQAHALSSEISALNDLSAAQVNAEADTALSDFFTSSAQLVDDIWDEDVDTSHQTAGTAGKKLDDAGGAADPWATALPGAYGAGTAGKIVGDNINATVSSRMAEASINTTGGAVDNVTLVDTTTTNTDMRGTDSAALASVCTETRLAELDAANLPADVDAILTDTGTTLDGKINTIDTIVDNLNLGIIYGAAQTGTLSTTAATTDLTGYTDDQLIGRVVIWTSGNCDGEATDITDYANTTGLLTFTALTTAPANGDTFKIV